MDIFCPRCGEPMDLLELHDNDFDLSFDEARKLFFSEGCGKVFDVPCRAKKTNAGEISALAAELMGDDVDGIASMMEDAEMFGLM